MDTPTAVVAMLGIESSPLSSEFILGPSEEDKDRCWKQTNTIDINTHNTTKGSCCRAVDSSKKANTCWFQFHKWGNALIFIPILCGMKWEEISNRKKEDIDPELIKVNVTSKTINWSGKNESECVPNNYCLLHHKGKNLGSPTRRVNCNRLQNATSTREFYLIMWFLCAHDSATVAFHEAVTASTKRKSTMVNMVDRPLPHSALLTSCHSVFEWMLTEKDQNWHKKINTCRSKDKTWDAAARVLLLVVAR